MQINDEDSVVGGQGGFHRGRHGCCMGMEPLVEERRVPVLPEHALIGRAHVDGPHAYGLHGFCAVGEAFDVNHQAGDRRHDHLGGDVRAFERGLCEQVHVGVSHDVELVSELGIAEHNVLACASGNHPRGVWDVDNNAKGSHEVIVDLGSDIVLRRELPREALGVVEITLGVEQSLTVRIREGAVNAIEKFCHAIGAEARIGIAIASARGGNAVFGVHSSTVNGQRRLVDRTCARPPPRGRATTLETAPQAGAGEAAGASHHESQGQAMAKLYFRYGAMNSSKTALLLTAAHNYEERDQHPVIVKPGVDTKAGASVSSRVGVARSVDVVLGARESLKERLLALRPYEAIDAVFIDEAQFLTPDQVDEAFEVAVLHGVPVLCYGLRGDFRTCSFPGSGRLMEIAHSIEELKTICRCGSKAMFNARIVGGAFVSHGAQVAIDGQQADYESLCGRCYIDKVGTVSHG